MNEGYNSQYVESYYVPDLPKKPKSLGYNPKSCVSYAKYKRPDQTDSWIAPKYVKAYDITPAAGLLVITTEGSVGHVAYVESVTETAIIVSEANYIPGLVTTREIRRDSPTIRGYR